MLHGARTSIFSFRPRTADELVLKGYHNRQFTITILIIRLLEIDVNYVFVLNIVKVNLLELIVHGHDEIRIHHALVTQLESVSSYTDYSLQERT